MSKGVDGEHLSATQDNGGSLYTWEELSECAGLNTKTLTNVTHHQKLMGGVTLAYYFIVFGLFQKEDYSSQSPNCEESRAVLADLLRTPLKAHFALEFPFYSYQSQAEQL